MTQETDASGSLALSPRPQSAARLIPKPTDGHRSLRATSSLREPVQPAELAQARVFEGLLQAERAELQLLAHRLGRANGPLPDSNGAERAEDLTQIRARLDEVHGLLRALRGRFPHTEPNAGR